jgi:hypothetical protein
MKTSRIHCYRLDGLACCDTHHQHETTGSETCADQSASHPSSHLVAPESLPNAETPTPDRQSGQKPHVQLDDGECYDFAPRHANLFCLGDMPQHRPDSTAASMGAWGIDRYDRLSNFVFGLIFTSCGSLL